jgi:hypothetical protein
VKVGFKFFKYIELTRPLLGSTLTVVDAGYDRLVERRQQGDQINSATRRRLTSPRIYFALSKSPKFTAVGKKCQLLSSNFA